MEIGNLRLLVMDNCKELGELINKNINLVRNSDFDYRIPVEISVFSNSESKARIKDSVRGKDTFIITDIGNYEQEYRYFGKKNRKSYNDNFMELLETIDACGNTTYRTWIIEPLLWGSRQHKKEARESLNAALGLRIMDNLGVKGILSYDVHDPTVRVALHNSSFDNIYPTNDMIHAFLDKEKIDFNNLLIIHPDEGAAKRAKYFGEVLDAPVGGFRKVRDTSKVVNGTCKIKEHEYTGTTPLKGKNLIVADDIIASGKSMIDVAKKAKEDGANSVYLFATYGLFSDGTKSINEFKKAYKKGYINKIYITNLTYIPQRISNQPWIEVVDCSLNVAKIIDALNRDDSIEPLMNGKDDVKEKVMIKKLNTTY